MKSSLSNEARKVLIRSGKALPFVLCLLVTVSYAEELYALVAENYVSYEGYTYLDTPITSRMAKFVKYDILIVILTLIVSVAIEACKWNFYATAYLFANLMEKQVMTFEFDTIPAYIFLFLNFAISAFFVYKGCCIFIKKC